MRDRGYIIPEIVDPEELMCLKVFIPNDPLYLAAFAGFYERLGTWMVWEKDGTNRASQASQVWKKAIDYTRENGWIGACGMSDECCEALIEAVNNISIVVNVSGVGGCCQPLNDWRMPPDWEDDWQDHPPLGDTPTTSPQGDLCDNAHETWSALRDLFDDFADLTLEEGAGYTYLYAYLQSKAAILQPPAAALFAVLTFAASVAYSLLEEDTLEFWQSFKEKFICGILSHDNAEDFYEWLKTAVNEDAPNFSVRTWVNAVLQMPDWNLLYDGEFDISPEFVGSDCSMCYQPMNANGYEWRAGSLIETTASEYTTELLMQDPLVDYTAVITETQSNFQPVVTGTPPIVEEGETLVGFTYYTIESETSGGVNDPASGQVRVNGDTAPAPKRELWYLTGHSGIQTLANFDEVDEDNAGQIEGLRLLEFYARVGTGQSPPGNAHVRVVAILWCVLLAE